jgi:hypothetical protein
MRSFPLLATHGPIFIFLCHPNVGFSTGAPLQFSSSSATLMWVSVLPLELLPIPPAAVNFAFEHRLFEARKRQLPAFSEHSAEGND